MKQEFIATGENNRKIGRLDVFLSEHTEISRSKIKKHIENGQVTVNDIICQDPAKKLMDGDVIALILEQEENTLQATENELTIHYQDEYLAVVEKKPYLTVHPCPSCQEETLVHHLLYHFPSLRNMEGERPGIVHRLDKDTSGLLLVALTEESRLRLTEMFSEKEVEKTYLALVQGICPKGESKESIGRHPTVKTKMALVPVSKGGREAWSEWERIYPDTDFEEKQKQILSKNNPLQKNLAKQEDNDNFSLVKVRIHTGRTHQIRIHLTASGYPLLGDEVYAPQKAAEKAPRQMLHAYHLSFQHPITNEYLEFKSLPPADFWACMEKELDKKQRAIPVIVTGNSGTGKSALLEIAARQNLPTFSADACIRELYEVNHDGWYLLKQQYGNRFVPDSRKPVDKIALATAMQEPAMKQELENLLHPLVYNRMLEFFAQNTTAPLAIAEIPLWFETKPDNIQIKARTICVSCDEETQLHRLHARGWNDETIAHMQAWQLPQEEKILRADYHLPNNGSLEELEKNFLGILANILKRNTSLSSHIIEKIKNVL